jgi:hypothetical protein
MEKYSKEKLEEAVSVSVSFAEVARKFGIKPHGGAQSHIKQKAIRLGIDYSHFKGQSWSKGRSFGNRRKSPCDILILSPKGSNRAHAYQLRRALVESGVEERCAICGQIPSWNGLSLQLEIDHIDGNYLNNLITNLRFVCPNCHSQTANYKIRNKRKR